MIGGSKEEATLRMGFLYLYLFTVLSLGVSDRSSKFVQDASSPSLEARLVLYRLVIEIRNRYNLSDTDGHRYFKLKFQVMRLEFSDSHVVILHDPYRTRPYLQIILTGVNQ